MTCQTLLGLEDASKSKPQLVSPMFKGMEGRSINVIEIIKNGYNPTDCPERILSYQPSWSFGVLIAFSNSVLCLSTQMRVCHMRMRTLIGHWLQGNLHAEHFLLVTSLSLIGRLDQAPASTAWLQCFKTLQTPSLNWSRPCSRAWKAGLCM